MPSITLRGLVSIDKPCRGIEPRSAVYRTAMSPSHPQGKLLFLTPDPQPLFQCLAWGLNPVRRIKSPLCQPLHPQGRL